MASKSVQNSPPAGPQLWPLLWPRTHWPLTEKQLQLHFSVKWPPSVKGAGKETVLRHLKVRDFRLQVTHIDSLLVKN